MKTEKWFVVGHYNWSIYFAGLQSVVIIYIDSERMNSNAACNNTILVKDGYVIDIAFVYNSKKVIFTKALWFFVQN